MLKYLAQKEAQKLDNELMELFTGSQLIELAGLSCATVVHRCFGGESSDRRRRALVLCGPGNNGADGLCCARHLAHFGWSCSIWYPKRRSVGPDAEENVRHLHRLTQQCQLPSIEFIDQLPEAWHSDVSQSSSSSSYACVVDAMFGFSFSGTSVRAPFDTAISLLNGAGAPPTVAVDVPSGWNVEQGNVHECGVTEPAVLVSLTAPKQCARFLDSATCRHFLGGRFVPTDLAQKYELNLPEYPGSDQIVEL